MTIFRHIRSVMHKSSKKYLSNTIYIYKKKQIHSTKHISNTKRENRGICHMQGLYHMDNYKEVRVNVMVFNATFNNISVISWRSALFFEETGVPGENHRPAASH